MLKLVKVFFAKKGKNDIKYTMPMGFQRHESNIQRLPFFYPKILQKNGSCILFFLYICMVIQFAITCITLLLPIYTIVHAHWQSTFTNLPIFYHEDGRYYAAISCEASWRT